MRKASAIIALVLSTVVIAGNAALYLALRSFIEPAIEQQRQVEDEPMTCSYEPRGQPISGRWGVASAWHVDCMAADTIGFGGENREDIYDCVVLSKKAPASGTLESLPLGQVLARSSARVSLFARDGALHVATRRGRLLERVEALDGVPLVFDFEPN